jgi:[protein-PII] uridylyltransferase
LNRNFTELVNLARTEDPAFGQYTREACLAEARRYHHEQRDAIRQRHEAGESGSNVVHLLTRLADEVVTGVLEFGLYYAGNRGNVLARSALCAMGGYGRSELCPHSDLDLVLLYEGRLTEGIRNLNAFLVPVFWDLGFKCGYVLHEVGEALQLARDDVQVMTSYLPARLLRGESTVLARLKLQLLEGRTGVDEAIFDAVRQREHTADQNAAHRDLYAPEPDIKDSVGGLRDFHAALWLLTVTYGQRSLDNLVSVGALAPEDHLRLLEGLDFLWRIRCEMHWQTGRCEDRLTFALQRKLAPALGYGGDTQPAVDRFMQDYYRAAGHVHRFLGLIQRLQESEAEIEQGDTPREFDLAARGGRICAGARDPQWFVEHPPRLMEVYWESARRGYPVGAATQRRITRNLHLVNEGFREAEMARRFFLAVCNRPLHAGRVLRQMAESGLLGAYLPEFAHVAGIVRYEDFHSYPVDEHTLRALEALGEVPSAEGNVGRFLEVTLEHVREPGLLVLAILFHDLGKVEGEAHTEAGVDIVWEACGRMGLPENDTERVAFLVRHHMHMTHTSMYRDTDDYAVVSQFADLLQTTDRLRDLLLLSHCDLKAVGPTVWTEWKGALLIRLYLKAERILMGGDAPTDTPFWESPKADAASAELAKLLPDTPGEVCRNRVTDHVRALGERYFFAYAAAEIASHVEGVGAAREQGLAVRTHVDETTGMTTVTVIAPDRHGLFALVTGSFTSQMVQVLRANVFTTPDGYALDCFEVLDARHDRPLTSAQNRGIEDVLRAVIQEGQDVQTFVDKSRRRLFAVLESKVPAGTFVRFDNDASQSGTVIDIETGDRTGLLYDIAQTLASMGVDFVSSRIVTDARRVRDAFHVKKDGRKLDRSEQDAVREALLQVLEPLAAAQH